MQGDLCSCKDVWILDKDWDYEKCQSLRKIKKLNLIKSIFKDFEN